MDIKKQCQDFFKSKKTYPDFLMTNNLPFIPCMAWFEILKEKFIHFIAILPHKAHFYTSLPPKNTLIKSIWIYNKLITKEITLLANKMSYKLNRKIA